MKKLILLSSLSTVMFAVSCKKEETKTLKDEIIGTWTVNYAGEDANGNGMLDASEKIVSTDYKNTITINSNGTATINYQRTASDPLESNTYNYSLNSEETIITMSSTSGVTAAYTIESVNGSNMVWNYQPAGEKKKWIGMSK